MEYYMQSVNFLAHQLKRNYGANQKHRYGMKHMYYIQLCITVVFPGNTSDWQEAISLFISNASNLMVSVKDLLKASKAAHSLPHNYTPPATMQATPLPCGYIQSPTPHHYSLSATGSTCAPQLSYFPPGTIQAASFNYNQPATYQPPHPLIPQPFPPATPQPAFLPATPQPASPQPFPPAPPQPFPQVTHQPASTQPFPPASPQPASPQPFPPASPQPASPQPFPPTSSQPQPFLSASHQPASPQPFPPQPFPQPLPQPASSQPFLPATHQPASPQPFPPATHQPASPQPFPPATHQPASPQPFPPATHQPASPQPFPPATHQPASPQPFPRATHQPASPQPLPPATHQPASPQPCPPSTKAESVPHTYGTPPITMQPTTKPHPQATPQTCFKKCSIKTLHLLKWEDEQGIEQTFCLSNKVKSRWKDFGTLLNLVDEVDAWDDKYRGDPDSCWKKVMKHWLDGGSEEDYPPTWEGLYDLLVDVRCSIVAKELKKVVEIVNRLPTNRH